MKWLTEKHEILDTPNFQVVFPGVDCPSLNLKDFQLESVAQYYLVAKKWLSGTRLAAAKTTTAKIEMATATFLHHILCGCFFFPHFLLSD